jgi:hypothetical protein
MEKIMKEAENYKNLPKKDLEKVIKSYKKLSRSNSKTYYFLYTFICMMVPALFLGVNFIGLAIIITFHYFFFMEYLYEYKKSKFVSDEEKEECDKIVEILEEYLKDK